MRLITRADFDGLICAVLLSELGRITDIYLTNASEIYRKRISVTTNDIIANLPFDARCGMWFDHHDSEVSAAAQHSFLGCFAPAASCAQVVYDYFIWEDARLQRFEFLVHIANNIDAARLTMPDVQSPQGWYLLSETLQTFYAYPHLLPLNIYFQKLVKAILSEPLENILEMPVVRQRLSVLQKERRHFEKMLLERSCDHGSVVVTDIRNVSRPAFGNRFLIYTLFPEQEISINLFTPRGKDVVVISCGQNIFHTGSGMHIGNLMKEFGGGGHRGAGSCEVQPDAAESVLENLIERIGAETK